MTVSSFIFGQRGPCRVLGNHVGGATGGRLARIGMTVMVLLALLWLLAASRVHVNASWSDSAWGYFVLPIIQDPKPGDLVVFEPVFESGFGLPTGDAGAPQLPYLKTILGIPGMHVWVDSDGTVTVGGMTAGKAKTHGLDGRRLKAIKPEVIPAGHYYVHAEHADSHDSRYAEIGLVPRERILGRAVPLPDLPWLGLAGPLVGPEDIEESGGMER